MSLAADRAAADAALVGACAAAIDVPKAEEPDSFVLHAPLELLARALLLERVPVAAAERAHARLRWLADAYEHHGPAAEGFDPEPTVAPLDELLVSLAAAAHGPILVNLRARVPAVRTRFGDPLVADELARHPDWNLAWPTARDAGGTPNGDLAVVLAAPPSPGDPGSDSIYPTMHLVDESGLAASVLTEPLRGTGPDEARRVLLRVAAHSMLQDDPDAAPYGWTHCLTLPQAVLATTRLGADPDVAVAVAATHVLGFRATQGRVRLEPGWSPPAGSAASAPWSADDGELPAVVEELVAFGAVHPDAHVAKYTLACLDAADADPPSARLFLAAAAHLHDWWRHHPPLDDPILGAG
jgi:hypothetical protein